MTWWINDPKRLADERREISAIDEEWFENPYWSLDNQTRLRLIFDIVMPHCRYRLAMSYHNTFPASPPSIRPVNNPSRISSHQYGAGGELCLSIRNDNWNPSFTGADMIRSAYTLLDMETPDEYGEVLSAPSAHDVSEAQLLRFSHSRFYVDPLVRISLASDDLDGSSIEVGVNSLIRQCSIAHLLSICNEHSIRTPIQVGAPYALRDSSFVYPGRFFIVDAPSVLVKKVALVEELPKIIGDRFTLRLEDMWTCLVRTSDNELLLLKHISGCPEVIHYETIVGPADPQRSGTDCDILAEKRVGIVGLGSLGSNISTSLARAGVGRFELVDGDILHPGNLERYNADWRDVGRHKSELMAQQLRLIHARVEAHQWQTALGAQVSSQEAGNVHAALAACDLLVDATANQDVFNHLAYLAMQNNRTLVWGAIYAGALGGEIARSRPNKDPSPFDIRNTMARFYQTVDEPPPLGSGNGYDGSTSHDEPLIANDADISVISGHIASIAIDDLVGTEPSAFNDPVYFIGLKRGWLFNGPFDCRPLNVEAPLRTTISGEGETNIDIGFLKRLIETLKK